MNYPFEMKSQIFGAFIFLSGIYCVHAETQYIFVKEHTVATLVCEKLKTEPVWKGPYDYTIYAVGTTINIKLRKRNRLRMIKVKSPPQVNLQIRNVSKEDEGLYKCTNQLSSNLVKDKIFMLQLQRDPTNMTIQNKSQNQFVFEYVNKPLALKCSVISGKPVETITWWTGNSILANSSNGSVVHTFTPSKNDHLKNFTCVAKNIFNQLNPLQRSVQLYLYLHPNVEIKEGGSMSVVEGRSVTLTCTYTSNHEITRLTWRFFSLYTATIEEVSQNNSILILDHIRWNQTGKYECIVENLAGTRKDWIYLNVQYSQSISLTYHKNETERYLKCSPKGYPDNYTFYNWQHISFYREQIRTLPGNGSGILQLRDTPEETDRHGDRGIYVCRVSMGIPANGGKVVSTDYFLNESGKPYFVSANNDIQYGILGHVARLEVFVVSIPSSNKMSVLNSKLSAVNASHNDDGHVKVFDKVYGKNITVLASRYSLYIQLNNDMNEDDFQRYTVIITNQQGSSAYVIFLKPASPPEKPLHVRLQPQENDILVSWQPGFNGGTNQSFFLNYKKRNENGWKLIPVGVGNRILLKKLESNTEYYIQMFAENKVGDSNFTERYLIKTGEKLTNDGIVLMVIAVSVAILVVCGFTAAIGIKMLFVYRNRERRNAASLENDQHDDIAAYDEVESILYSPPENVVQENIGQENQMYSTSSSIVVNTVYTVDQMESRICLNEVLDTLSNDLSNSSTESSESLYLNPSRPYTELKHIRHRTSSFHDYDHLMRHDEPTLILSAKLPSTSGNTEDKRNIKRSTI